MIEHRSLYIVALKQHLKKYHNKFLLLKTKNNTVDILVVTMCITDKLSVQ